MTDCCREDVTHPANRLDELRVPAVQLHLLAQAGDLRVDGAVERF